jgi:hypothetical protein
LLKTQFNLPINEWTQLLAKLRELVPADLQQKIDQAVSTAAEAREVVLKTSHSGAANADAE